MARCPNCGSTVRSGAKFCTTCGYRLPAESAPEAENAGSRSPFDITVGSPTGSGWPPLIHEPTPEPDPEIASERSSDIDAPATSDVEAEPENAPDETPTNDEEPAPMAGWPAFGESLNVGSAWERTANDDSATEDTDGDQQKLADAVDSWSDQVGSDDSNEPSSDLEPTAFESVMSVTDDATSSDDSVIELPSSFSDEEPVVPIEDASIEDDAQPAPPPVVASTADPVSRATALINELQALLPSLGGSTSGGASVDANGVANDLANALEAHAPNPETLASLRAAVATAQARPRDVDVMLDFVGRAGAMNEVIGAFDDYVGAIDAAIKKLRGEQDEEPAPRW